jgi:hypothetical protein
VELAEQQSRLAERGLAIAAISYDTVAILNDFATRREIRFPLLSDPESEVIRAFGLLNEEYGAGHEIHGVPHPGTLVIDAKGRVVEKYFEEGYRPRRTAASVLLHSGDAGEGASRVETPQFALTTSLSDPRPFPGNRITLALDFEMAEGHHAYAPGDHGYRALDLELAPHPLLTPHETLRPESTPFHFAPLDETVPVYAGRFRLLRDVTLAAGRPMSEALEASSQIRIEGTLRYQVCSDRICYPPASLPLSWTLDVRPLEGERVPEALRKR